ncbi:MAG: hypothetical protein KME27_16925 [Lyngbya sp. HA4199-MV5]|jgi:hypothetical protein|nr:hypothetical protein [Lyngbya sp. HA4199-MV5]
MSKIKWLVLVVATCLISVLCYTVISFSQSPQASVSLTTEPSIAQAMPLEAEATKYLGSGQYHPPVQLKFQARDTTGAPLQKARFHLQILTPVPTPWFTTDFPIVEGTKLLDLTGDAPTGAFQLQQVFPIRGTYQLQVAVMPIVANAFAPIEQTLTLTVPENPLKFRYFPIVLGVLLTIGFGGGWIIGGRQGIQSGEIAPLRVRLLLSGVTVLAIVALLFFDVSAELGQSHAGMAMPEAAPPADTSGLIQSQGLKLALTGDDQTAVGQLASFQAKLLDRQTNQPVNDAIFAVKATQLENNWVAFAYQGVPDTTGSLTWQEQLFDGASHKIEVAVSPSPNSSRQFKPFQVTKEIEVEGIAPPIAVRLVGLLYFTGVLVLGLLAGLWLQRRRLRFSDLRTASV